MILSAARGLPSRGVLCVLGSEPTECFYIVEQMYGFQFKTVIEANPGFVVDRDPSGVSLGV